MNDEELLTGGLPELTEEELLEMQQTADLVKPFMGDAEPEPKVTPLETQEQTQEQPQVQEEQITEEPKLREVVKTSPFRNEDGSLNWEKLDRYGAEGDVDVLAGLWDFAAPILDKIPGVTAKPVPKFENEMAQTVREISSVVLPTMALGTEEQHD